MFQDCFAAYYTSLRERAEADYRRASQYQSVEGIHDFRVDVKRLRALFNLVAWLNPTFPAKRCYKPIRRVFKAGGRMRDPQVQQELVRTQVKTRGLNLSEYFNDLKAQEIAAGEAFTKVCKKFDLSVFTQIADEIAKALAPLDDETAAAKTQARFNLIIARIVAYRDKQQFVDEDYHQIRINAKESRYVLEIAQHCFPNIGFSDELNNRIRAVHQSLGKWHDAEIGLHTLAAFRERQGERPFFSPESYEQFAGMLAREKAKQLKAFEQRWRKALSLLEQQPVSPIATPQ